MNYETYLSHVWASKPVLLFGAALLAIGFGFEHVDEQVLSKALMVTGSLVVVVPFLLPLLLKDHVEK